MLVLGVTACDPRAVQDAGPGIADRRHPWSAISSRPRGSPRAGATARPANSRSPRASSRSVPAALVAWGGFTGAISPTPVGRGPVFVFGRAAACSRGSLRPQRDPAQASSTPAQRIWRVTCGGCASPSSSPPAPSSSASRTSLPAAVRGSPMMFVLALRAVRRHAVLAGRACASRRRSASSTLRGPCCAASRRHLRNSQMEI